MNIVHVSHGIKGMVIWLVFQLLAYWFICYMLQEMDLSALQERPVSATSMIPFSLYVTGDGPKCFTG